MELPTLVEALVVRVVVLQRELAAQAVAVSSSSAIQTHS
jgi:hypothetical protein